MGAMSGAGQNRVGSYGGKQLFAANITTAASTPTLGVNDTGPIMTEALGFTKWLFQPVGTWGAGTAQVVAYVLGTTDKLTAGYTSVPTPTDPNGIVAPTQINWFPIPAPSSETTGDAIQWANPLYGNNSTQVTAIQTAIGATANVTDALLVQAPLTAIRVVVLIPSGASGTATQPNANVLAFAVN